MRSSGRVSLHLYLCRPEGASWKDFHQRLGFSSPWSSSISLATAQVFLLVANGRCFMERESSSWDLISSEPRQREHRKYQLRRIDLRKQASGPFFSMARAPKERRREALVPDPWEDWGSRGPFHTVVTAAISSMDSSRALVFILFVSSSRVMEERCCPPWALTNWSWGTESRQESNPWTNRVAALFLWRPPVGQERTRFL